MRFSSFTYLFGQGLHNLRANKMMTFASMGVLTVCMILIGAAYLFGINVDAMVAYIGSQNKTIVYMDYDLSEEQLASADSAIRSISGVVSVTYVSPSDVLENYSDMLEDYTNLKEAFQDDNPFRANYIVVMDDVGNMEEIVAQLRNVEGVYKVNALLEMSRIFLSIQRVVNYTSYILVGVLALVSVVVINNTIKITVFNRRKEIGIMKLVGATNGFIRFPFFVEGVVTGFFAAVIASVLVLSAYYALVYWYDSNPTNLTQMFGGTLVPVQDVWYLIAAAFLIFGFVLCGIGTATSIRKHMDV